MLVSSLLSAFTVNGAVKVDIEGSSNKIIHISPDKSTGLNELLVVRNISGCQIVCNQVDGFTAIISRYSNLGGGYAEEVKNITRNDNSIVINSPEGDMGYILEDRGTFYYFWVVNYHDHVFKASSLRGAESQDCDYTNLVFNGEASPITYYTINGQPKVLSREIYINYVSQEFNEEESRYETTGMRKTYESLTSNIAITPPAYCATYFTLSGDRFLREWGEEIEVESGVIEPMAVECHTIAEQWKDDDEMSNVIKVEGDALGGSAPADIDFYAYTTEGVIHNEWQFSRDSEFRNLEYRFTEKNLSYTFNDEGTYYVRYVGSNYDGTCETFGDVFTVNIGASELICPNAFSPNGDGVNDIWKVSYRSLVDFHCEIFNRNGQKIYGFDSPEGGWDGTWHGKRVKPGVYFYVIMAKGADGKEYKKSGDINILGQKYNPMSGSASEGDTSDTE